MQDLKKYSYAKVNMTMVAVNAAVYLICLLTGNALYQAGENNAILVLRAGQYWRLLTAMFLHAGPEHLLGNLFALFLLGMPVERNLGHLRYLLLYIASGVLGNLFSCLYEQAIGANIYSVGASGAIFGVMGALVVIVVRARRQLRRGSSLLVRIGIAVAYAVYSGFQSASTDNAAHIGGLAVGIVLAILLTAGKDEMDLRDLR